MRKYKFSNKFYLGIILIIVSFIIGKITTATFIIYFNNQLLKWISLIIYIISWPMLILGIWWIGEEYASMIKKYISYKFYHESAKRGARKAVHSTKRLSKKVGHKTKQASKKITSRIKKNNKRFNKYQEK